MLQNSKLKEDGDPEALLFLSSLRCFSPLFSSPVVGLIPKHHFGVFVDFLYLKKNLLECSWFIVMY